MSLSAGSLTRLSSAYKRHDHCTTPSSSGISSFTPPQCRTSIPAWCSSVSSTSCCLSRLKSSRNCRTQLRVQREVISDVTGEQLTMPLFVGNRKLA